MKAQPPKDLERELRRGTLDLVLLRLLADEPTYGYELLKRLRSRSGGAFQLKEGTLYPVLYRLEDAGLIVPEWTSPEAASGQRAPRGMPRKVYRPTEAGRQRLVELEAAWTSFKAGVDAVLESAEPTEEES